MGVCSLFSHRKRATQSNGPIPPVNGLLSYAVDGFLMLVASITLKSPGLTPVDAKSINFTPFSPRRMLSPCLPGFDLSSMVNGTLQNPSQPGQTNCLCRMLSPPMPHFLHSPPHSQRPLHVSFLPHESVGRDRSGCSSSHLLSVNNYRFFASFLVFTVPSIENPS